MAQRGQAVVNMLAAAVCVGGTVGGWVYAAGQKTADTAALVVRVETLEKQRHEDRETLVHVSDQVDAIGDKLGVPRRR